MSEAQLLHALRNQRIDASPIPSGALEDFRALRQELNRLAATVL